MIFGDGKKGGYFHAVQIFFRYKNLVSKYVFFWWEKLGPDYFALKNLGCTLQKTNTVQERKNINFYNPFIYLCDLIIYLVQHFPNGYTFILNFWPCHILGADDLTCGDEPIKRMNLKFEKKNNLAKKDRNKIIWERIFTIKNTVKFEKKNCRAASYFFCVLWAQWIFWLD